LAGEELLHGGLLRSRFWRLAGLAAEQGIHIAQRSAMARCSGGVERKTNGSNLLKVKSLSVTRLGSCRSGRAPPMKQEQLGMRIPAALISSNDADCLVGHDCAIRPLSAIDERPMTRR